jgi:pimeloyl-ACP methyl ester carboxylesterase
MNTALTSSIKPQFRLSCLVLIDAGHFVWEEAPAEYASIILGAIARRSS